MKSTVKKMLPENIAEIVSGTLVTMGGIGVILNKVGFLHFGKRNGKPKEDEDGFIVVRQCSSHDKLVKELIETKKEVADVKADTSYIRGRLEAMK